jgi:hypothetical protein
VWLGAGAPAALPDRFAWTVLSDADHRRLPDRTFGLVVVEQASSADTAAYTRLVGDRGYLLIGSTAPQDSIPEELSLESLAEAAGRHIALLRRRP